MADSFRAEELDCERGGRRVFARLSFALAPGGALLLKGANGSGKSSLLRLCAGLLHPAGGRLLRGDVPVADDMAAHRADLHYVGHLTALKPALTLRRNLELWAALHGADEPREAACAGLARFRLDPLAEFPARLLSAGQQRRAALARLLLRPAGLWLLDEPTVGLDDRSIADLGTIMAEHRAGGGVILAASHQHMSLDGAELLQMADFAPTALAGEER